MKSMGLNEIRKAFLDFYESKDHYVTSSYSLVPQGDKSLLLVNAGMQPLKKYFMGTEMPPKPRMATCQKCIRTGDIENVGVTARHATFFEMLGNFSFGDYFKEGSIRFGWEFITEVLELPVDKLWPSVYFEDDEAFTIWRDVIGIPEEKITRLGKEDNFWEIGTGPCGPCSEIYFDRGPEYGCGDPDCKPGCECERFLEFWNHVFTQYDKDDQGNYNLLENPNIDTGMGLERIACIMQDVDTIFEVDTIKSIRDAVISMCNVVYGENRKQDISIRIITDHVKAITFMVGDGIMPNNEGRGYVLRRLLRRAARHAKMLGLTGNVLTELVDSVMAAYGESYPNLLARKDYIKKIISVEEERFQTTIDQGLAILTAYIEEMESNQEETKVLSGEKAFRLYDTYGFPLELTLEILEEHQMTVDEESFKAQMTMQKERARSARGSGDELGWAQDALGQLPKDMASEFVGYDQTEVESKIIAIVGESLLDEAFEGMEVSVVLDRTPFYPEGGGQVFDTGKLSTAEFEAEVEETRKSVGKLIALHVKVNRGSIKVGDMVHASVDLERRLAIARNHSTTHLLHKALREVLGTHVEQAGSLVSPERLRFDFSHFEAVSYEDLQKIETRVNDQILKMLPIQTENMSIDAARAKGAMALFGEKYGDKVRVVTMGDYSIELCGGTHLKNTAEAGLFKIVSETGVAAGVRRIEAITGENVYKMLTQLDGKIQLLSDMLKTNQNDLEKRVETLILELKQSQRENEKLKNKLVTSDIDGLIQGAKVIQGMNVITADFTGIDMTTLRNLTDQLKTKLENSVVVLANTSGDKVEFLAVVSDEAVKLGAHAGNLIREVAKVAGGGGGGKPNMAQAGGKHPEKVKEALAKVYELLS
ncbi:alanine--tRNA ligase [Fusibacter ferrireducens]|uniref:Alanine--tRNA ligase n=1 Tax=Fusibacter ferrireducens TaxID=2785058 RepID=A0ABR9ZTA4_9FIRM|nr:alanine--tRNA ligase [Fusibacter ferrireducens]MBF4693703.1 alanine--tRNA ligase [Fusibacter ferrireducens]